LFTLSLCGLLLLLFLWLFITLFTLCPFETKIGSNFYFWV